MFGVLSWLRYHLLLASIVNVGCCASSLLMLYFDMSRCLLSIKMLFVAFEAGQSLLVMELSFII